MQKNGINKSCRVCGKLFYIQKCRERRLYCSYKCRFKIPFSEEHKIKISISKKGQKSVLGKHWKLSKQAKDNIRESHRGIKNYLWKGCKVSYRNLHSWVERELGKANHCEECGLDKIPEDKKRYFQWANISHKYKRDLKDWIQLCIKCHKQYDKK